MSKKTTTIGIDLGTTTSCVAGYAGTTLDIIVNREGERITPSVVCFDKNSGAPIVGSNGILAATSNPYNFIFEVKRMLGKGFHSDEIQKGMKHWPFRVVEIKTKGEVANKDVTDNIGIKVTEGDKERIYEPIQISAYVLNYLYESAKTRLGSSPSFVAITVPAYFSDGAKQRTLDAAKIAFSGKKDDNNNDLDIKVVLLAEPTAAAIAYGSILLKSNQVRNGEEQTILVFDLGGGTFDVSILNFCFDKDSPVGMVKAIDGDNNLGGSDWDNVIIDFAKKTFAEKNPDFKINMSDEEMLKNTLRLRQEAIKVKNALSSNLSVTFNLPCYIGTRDLIFEITRVQFERASRHLFDKLKEKVTGVLLSAEGVSPVYDDAGKLNEAETIRANPQVRGTSLSDIAKRGKSTIQKVIMVGGSSRIPKVKSLLEEYFGETADTPADKKKVVAPLNPDEAVAYGAGYYANAVCPSSGADDEDGPKLLLIDQVPLNLNIETLGGVATPLITARTSIPCKQTQIFTTAENNQPEVEIVITQGNRPVSAHNYLIGKFRLSGIAPAPKGTPQIEVTFEVNQNNVLHVTAMDKSTGKKEMYVQNQTNKLTEEDIRKMTEAAEKHAEMDAIFSKRVQLKNSFEHIIYEFEDKLEQLNLDESKKTSIKSKLADEQTWLKTQAADVDPQVIESRMETFKTEMAAMMQGGAAPTNNPDVEEVN